MNNDMASTCHKNSLTYISYLIQTLLHKRKEKNILKNLPFLEHWAKALLPGFVNLFVI